MQFRVLIRFISILLLCLGVSMAIPLIVAFILKDGSAMALLYSTLITIGSGFFLMATTIKVGDKQLNHRDGVAIVSLGWLTAALFGTLPYLLSDAIPDFTNAYFESISGFTTTGSSILTDIEDLPKGILLWRSLTQWIGGMGIIVLSIAILPFLGVGGMQLYKAEIPSPVVDKLKPRISETAKVLWKVYLLFTVAEFLFLLAGGMSAFDSICHAFCTMPTGGFSTKNTSVAFYDSAYLDFVIVFFMLVAGFNFSLHFKLLKGDYRTFGKDLESKVFIGLTGLFTVIITFDIYVTVADSISGAFRYASFQVASIITTTGFVTADYEQWPALSKHILLLCMFLGSMAGSTGGGIKIMRVILLIKHGYQQIFRIIHPHAVKAVKLGGKSVPQEVMTSVWGFFVLYLALFLGASLFMTALGLDLISSFASVAASIGNVGPGLGIVGPVQNYLSIPDAGKWMLIFCMLLGRLEIYTVIVLLVPEYWRK